MFVCNILMFELLGPRFNFCALTGRFMAAHRAKIDFRTIKYTQTMNNLSAETLAQVAILAPTCSTYRSVQLAHATFDSNPCKQFWVRDRLRTWLEKPKTVNTYRQQLQTLPSGKNDGHILSFYDNGKLHGHGHHVNNCYHGNYVMWHESGSLKERCVYRYGQMHGERTSWNRFGTMVTLKCYDSGNLHGTCWGRDFVKDILVPFVYNHGQLVPSILRKKEFK